MTVLYYFVIVLHVIACLFLIAVVLLQPRIDTARLYRLQHLQGDLPRRTNRWVICDRDAPERLGGHEVTAGW